MATNFPASLDTLTNPTSSDSLSSPSHSAQHANVNDAVEALQAKVGVDSSAVTTSLDYKVAQLEGRDTAGLVLVSETTVGTAVSSVTVSNVFSADYDNYSIRIDNVDPSSNTLLNFQLDGLTTSYYYNGINMAGTTTVNGDNGLNVSAWQIGACRTTGENSYILEVRSPFLAGRNAISFDYAASGLWYTGGGITTNTASRTGFVLTPGVGTLTGGTIRVYGYAKA
jgi:hypothetical protein